MSGSFFDMNEFMKKDEPKVEPEVEEEVEVAEEEPVDGEGAELDVQKAVVESLAADKAEMDHQMAKLRDELAVSQAAATAAQAASDLAAAAIASKEAECAAQVAQASARVKDLTDALAKRDDEIHTLKAELARREAEIAALMEKEFDQQERNPNALALLDREIEVPDRFPGETRDHVLEVISAARETAEKEGKVRRAQLLEAVLVANEPNGTLAKKRAELEKLFAENANLVNGPVLEELKKRGISPKNGEDYLLPAEIMKRSY